MVQKCRVCGCEGAFACPGGCFWVEEDLCSRCAQAIFVCKIYERMIENDFAGS